VTNRWAVNHAPLIDRAVLILCCGVSMGLYESKPSSLAKTVARLGPPVEMPCSKSPCTVAANWFTHALMSVSPTKNEARDAKRHQSRVKWPHPMEYYLASAEEMAAHGFPRRDDAGALPPGFVETVPRPAHGGPAFHRLVGCDCEMVRCASGLALARLTLVAEKGEVLLDVYVRPDEPIVDYNTRWSGITEKEMAAAEIGLAGAQERFRELVSADTGECARAPPIAPPVAPAPRTPPPPPSPPRGARGVPACPSAPQCWWATPWRTTCGA